MFLSIFDIFKVGVGPSSSHTMGPMTAAARFLDQLRTGEREPGAGQVAALAASLHGSLAFTGKGHATDRAVMLGFLGFEPATLDPDAVDDLVAALAVDKQVVPDGLGPLRFDPDQDLIFDYDRVLEGHANGMIFKAFDGAGNLYLQETYYSVGGGFVVTEAELSGVHTDLHAQKEEAGFPYPFGSAVEMLEMGQASGKTIAQMKEANELSGMSRAALDRDLEALRRAMFDCIDRGLRMEGELPGGVLPAVLRYYRDHCVGASEAGMRDFLLTAAAIGGLIKHNASISGAEVGCQGEVGSASSMAAAGLCAALGGTNAQIENAAEIALEHHLGMTCDPVAGLVQVPCIERNGLGAIKAVSAASLSLRGDGTHFMPLDNCIEAMRQTGIDMSTKYKETSQGGLAVNIPEC